LGIFIKIWPENSSLVGKKGQKISGAVREDLATYMCDLSLNSHLWRKFQTKLEKSKT